MIIDAVTYLLFAGLLQGALTAVVALVLGLAKLMRRRVPFMRWMISWLALNFWLLVFGEVGNTMWYAVADGWLYTNHDPMVGWVPFMIPGNWTIDPVCGGALTGGTTWWHMYALWAAIAIPVWGLTMIALRWTRSVLFTDFRRVMQGIWQTRKVLLRGV